jgi:hypothetical protein
MPNKFAIEGRERSEEFFESEKRAIGQLRDLEKERQKTEILVQKFEGIRI